MRKFAAASLIAIIPLLGMGAANAGPFDTGSSGSGQARTQNERTFLQQARDDGYTVDSENDLLTEGYAACGVLRNGGTMVDAAVTLHDRGLTEDASIDLTVDAAYYLCPEFKNAPIS
ncbi:DUF732 domain-containing protein [Nocardia huaxiensis]|uniref:DUF732 domain-containing protein n=1 Tax=Nocardia huaxiensis TaxID=2755382 RepID=A0A7D6Z4Z9_9NOCA|nr:DUF732 domain-containing protein [Nocardia huaxiensis]QLY33046.1 DUF732 domain-containing protein [Nocardia huaxiensis]UFS93191.1 DUF732 domain-containing protein [Nocardia huaxiensis]